MQTAERLDVSAFEARCSATEGSQWHRTRRCQDRLVVMTVARVTGRHLVGLCQMMIRFRDEHAFCHAAFEIVEQLTSMG